MFCTGRGGIELCAVPRVLLSVALMLVVACAASPPRVETRVGGPDGSAIFDASTLIPYRTLNPADFRAGELPRELRGLGLGAITVVCVYATPCNIQTVSRGVANDRWYEAIVSPFYYEARMNPARSWWDPNQNLVESHFLDHEQTHFAIAEVGVRRANVRIEEIRAQIRSRGETREEALRLAEIRFAGELHRVQDEISDRNARFDTETANGQRERRNDRWVATIKRELDETAAALSSSAKITP